MAKSSSRAAPAYWERRLFRATYTYRGQRRRVPGWCIKVQWNGKRRTVRMQAGNRSGAAREAAEWFAALRRGGWGEADRWRKGIVAAPRRPESEGNAATEGPWGITPRKYVSDLNAGFEREFFASLSAGGVIEHVPLGTEDFGEATQRARGLWNELQERGWEWMRRAHGREATVAVFWMANPMTCTYTTLLTHPARHGAVEPPRQGEKGWRVLVIEPDEGVRRALCHWLGREEGVVRVEGCPLAAEVIPGPGWDLIMANREQPAGALRDRFDEAAVQAPRFLTHGVYADSDAIFASFSGVSEGYLLRRLPPSRLLEPLAAAFREGRPPRLDDEERQVSRYFQGLFDPAQSRERRQAVELTSRELEVLDLLCRGFVDKEVAGELGISVWTVHSHLKRIFAKYGVRTRTEAVVRHLQK